MPKADTTHVQYAGWGPKDNQLVGCNWFLLSLGVQWCVVGLPSKEMIRPACVYWSCTFE